MKPYGLVLAGGGAKGAYQMGAWRAIRELGIEISSVAGVSIGSINGALIAADNYDGAIELWKSVSVDRGVNITAELKEPDNLFSVKNFPVLLREIVRNGGIDASPTKTLLERYISEDDVRNSKIKLSIVTFMLSGMTPQELSVDEIPQGQLVDYLLASSHYPGVSKIGPENESYIDGGVYDNAPIALMRKLGCNRMIFIDISSIKGIGHKQAMSCSELIYIRPYNIDDLGAAFDFSDQIIENRLKMGYMDTKKAFGYLAGQIYYFEPEVAADMLKKYGADACEQLQLLALKVKLPRLQVYGEEEFIASLRALYIDYERTLEHKREEREQKFYGNILKKNPQLVEKIVSIKPTKDYGKAIEILVGQDNG